jgi:GTPase SAR1 family protein
MLLRYVRWEVRRIFRKWRSYRRKLFQKTSSLDRQIIADLDDIFLDAISRLLANLQTPTLKIVTTGTTSSGKSTLVNLLCGAEIVPVAVQEMSAGLVTIEHSKRKAIYIDRTPNALWDCGDWYHPSDREIYDRLSAVMNSYLQAKERGLNNIGYPQIRIEYPLRLLSKNSRLKLPQGVQLKIIDLPGLSHQEDRENLSLIKTCDRALFLVTYNSAETDREKTKLLLQSVLEQLQIVSSLSNSILFLFNRIDVFYSDRDRVESAERSIARTKGEINKLLSKYQLQIESSQVCKISTMPALLSLMMQSKDDKISREASIKLNRNFNFLIPDRLAENLPRNQDKWRSEDRELVATAIWDISYAGEFDRVLITRIHTNLFELIFLPIIREIERELCAKISNYFASNFSYNPIEFLIINQIRISITQLINKIEYSLYIFIKLRQIADLLTHIPLLSLSKTREGYSNFK